MVRSFRKDRNLLKRVHHGFRSGQIVMHMMIIVLKLCVALHFNLKLNDEFQ